jgi:hypothetical protein
VEKVTWAESRAIATTEGGGLEEEALGGFGFVGEVRTMGVWRRGRIV